MNYSSLKAIFLRRFHLPKARTLDRALKSFSVSERAVFWCLGFLFAGSALVMLARVSSSFKTKIPVRGGTLSEGVVGNPRFVNPVLALSEADKDVSALVYSGLVRFDPDGQAVNDLADDVNVSKDGLVYTAHIRDGAAFSDGQAVTANDVLFTIEKVVDPSIKSPSAGDWSGVTVSKVDDRTITFTLKKAYAPFIGNLAVGILPKRIWQNVSGDEFAFSQFNTQPVGSGPYQVSAVERDSGGIPDYFDLVPNEHAPGTKPYITHMIFRFYPSEAELLKAYSSGDIDALGGVSANEADLLKKGGEQILSAPLPRIFGVFFNQSQNKALLDKDVRKALDLAAPKSAIVAQVLGGYGTPLAGPVPPGLLGDQSAEKNNAPDDTANLDAATALLAKDGWTVNAAGVLEKKSKSDTITLSFSLSTGDAPELTATANLLKAAWQKLGAQVDVKVYASGDLNQNVIRPRHFEALLFGEVVGRDADLYPFWHSSERTDPGLNIALYANSKADKLLETIRTDTDPDKREKDYASLSTEITQDIPAVFLYAPNYVYAVPADLKGTMLGGLSSAEDRFADARARYLETDSVWDVFVNH